MAYNYTTNFLLGLNNGNPRLLHRRSFSQPTQQTLQLIPNKRNVIINVRDV